MRTGHLVGVVDGEDGRGVEEDHGMEVEGENGVGGGDLTCFLLILHSVAFPSSAS